MILAVLKNALRLFIKNDPLRMGGATAFFTMFALPPILIIIVQIFGLFVDPQTIKHGLFVNLSDVFGVEAVRQIVSVIRAFRKIADNTFANIAGFMFLLFVATTVFKVMKSCIDQIWDIDKPPDKKPLSTLRSRLQSLLVIIIAGVLFLLGILLETVQVIISRYFIRVVPAASSLINFSISFIVSTLIVAVWFLIVFRYLPIGRPQWRVAWVGGLFTSFLFSIGKTILHLLLTYNNITTIYGVSASIVLLLLFIFYSAMIIYYGAAFTKMWALYTDRPIRPANR